MAGPGTKKGWRRLCPADPSPRSTLPFARPASLRCAHQRFYTSKALFPLSSVIEFELAVSENAVDDLIFYFNHAGSPPMSPVLELHHNFRELNSEFVFLGFSLEELSFGAEYGRRAPFA